MITNWSELLHLVTWSGDGELHRVWHTLHSMCVFTRSVGKVCFMWVQTGELEGDAFRQVVQHRGSITASIASSRPRCGSGRVLVRQKEGTLRKPRQVTVVVVGADGTVLHSEWPREQCVSAWARGLNAALERRGWQGHGLTHRAETHEPLRWACQSISGRTGAAFTTTPLVV